MRNMFIFLLIISLPAFAHDTVTGYTCTKPGKPDQAASLMEKEIFHAQLAIFEGCMFDYIRNQQRQASVHDQAAQTALDEWNNFIQSEL